MKTLQYLILSLAALMLSLGCKKECQDPCNIDCENYDPCCGKMPADARFQIIERLNNPVKQENFYTKFFEVDTDTIFWNNSVTFRALYDAEYYAWKVGTDEREWNTKEFTLGFRGVTHYKPIEITLKVYKPASESCNPNAKDTAVFTRTLITVPLDSLKIWGSYMGKIKSKAHENHQFILNRVNNKNAFSGLLPRCNTNSDNTGSATIVGYKQFFLIGGPTLQGCCLNIGANGKIDENENLIINFQFGKPKPHPTAGDSCSIIIPTIWLNDSFTGKKEKE